MGLTRTPIQTRIKEFKSKYCVDIIKTYTLKTELAYNIEQYIHNSLLYAKYKPLLSFCCYTECYSNVEDILKYIEETINETK